MPVATIAELWRYPVKSLGGERLATAELGPGGIEGDRQFGVVDVVTGKVLSAKTVPRLLEGEATWRNGVVEFRGSPMEGATSVDEGIDQRLSAWLERPVRLASATEGQRTTFDLPLDPDRPDELIELQTPPGSYFDSRSTLHLLTDASLRSAAALYPAGDWHPRRFRPNVLLTVVDADDGFPEDGWVGADLTIGSIEAFVRKASARCVVTAQPQPGCARDVGIFRFLARERSGNLGIYVDPRGAGRLAEGDPVDLRG